MTSRGLLRFKAPLPWDISQDDIERLRGFGAVDLTYVVEGVSRREVIRDVSDEMVGWHHSLGDPYWWQENLSRGRRVP